MPVESMNVSSLRSIRMAPPSLDGRSEDLVELGRRAHIQLTG